MSVSIHAPARGATRKEGQNDENVKFQSTPLREGRRQIRQRTRKEADVSIHAPARGATDNVSKVEQVSTVSIHAPARGATNGWFPDFCLFCGFNPRPCARGD